MRRAARDVLVAEPAARVDYLALVDPHDLADVPEHFRGDALLAVAARVGSTRLIDNTPSSWVTRRTEGRASPPRDPH